jgi:hypothetical protein
VLDAKLDAKLGIEDGQSLNDVLDAKLDAKLGIGEGETFDDKLNANNAKPIDMLGAKFDAKLGIGDGISVNLPKMERQLHALKSVVPDAASTRRCSLCCWNGNPFSGLGRSCWGSGNVDLHQ